MKKYFKLAMYAITSFLVAYLIGCFYSATFDLSIWTLETRFVISMVGIIAIIMSIMVVNVDNFK